MSRALMALILVCALCSASPAGDFRLTVRSDPPGAFVYLDTLLAGTTPLVVDSLEGAVTLRLVGRASASWLAPVRVETLTVEQDTIVEYRLRDRYYLNTVPSGAEVFRGGSLAGITPLVFGDSLLAEGTRLALRKPGYQDLSIGRTELALGSLILPLEVLPGETPEQKSMVLGTASSRRLRLHLSGYSTLLFGLMTAYLKSRADQANQDWLRTQDPAFLTRRNRLDQQAAVSIIATAISLGFFIYFLLLE